MAKNPKLNIKNQQIAKAINLDSVKGKLAKKKAGDEEDEKKTSKPKPAVKAKAKPAKAKEPKMQPVAAEQEIAEEPRRVRARTKSVFAAKEEEEEEELDELQSAVASETQTTSEEPQPPEEEVVVPPTPVVVEEEEKEEVKKEVIAVEPEEAPIEELPKQEELAPVVEEPAPKEPVKKDKPVKLGPTGRHVKDLLPPKPPKKIASEEKPAPRDARTKPAAQSTTTEDEFKKAKKTRFKEYRDLKPAKKQDKMRSFDARDRQGLRESDDDKQWRRRRQPKQKSRYQEDLTIRPTSLSIRTPITVKDLASEMKLKAAQLVQKLFIQGVIKTINDYLDDETEIQLLGHEFGCEISIDTAEEERIRITDKTVKEEIGETPDEKLIIRAPVVAFMGHVDHGKTSLIDSIRKSNLTSGEAGAITQHIGAFKCSTPVGDIAILDTPGHEAFSAMRARGADVTDIVVLVVAGDEGLKEQTAEAIQHAKAAGVTIVVAINKCDKPGFNPENVYRQLSEHSLLPEPWGGEVITVNCSAKTGEGVKELLEMLALQAEVLELRANPSARARGSVLESEMHKGLGAVTTVLVQNGTLRKGDALVFEQYWGRVKTMHDEHSKQIDFAGPSTPVEITGLSGLPAAGQEFIVVENEKEAREIAEARALQLKESSMIQKKTMSAESLLQQVSDQEKKVLNVILRADMQGSLEALKTALMKIESDKVDLNIIFTGVGEVSESDVQLAAASKALILGFHTAIESHADSLVKQYGVQVRLHDIIYHAIDDVKEVMTGLLDRLEQERDTGKAEVRATFKSSQHGLIAGCYVTEGTIHRNNHIRLIRNGEQVWKGAIESLKRVKEDVREVKSGVECGILLPTNDIAEGDIIEAYEIIYITQKL
ncbi:MAG: translation initiation factor IF-2 [Chlamydiales bacterium]|nr:translation initiation factor IF-2 [Chlamydiia bacterium]MCP5507244.1 translation initiation factor IF-2 [Chlamydiales bacterium]